jgi:hypothetical protein
MNERETLENLPMTTRRKLLGAGAAGVGAVALGALPLDAAAADTVPLAESGEPGGAGGWSGGALAIPATPAGAHVTVAHSFDAQVVGAGNEKFFSIGAWSTDGVLRMPLDVPPGARVLRVDFYAHRSAVGTVTAEIWSAAADATAFDNLFDVTTASGSGIIQGSNTTPFTVAPGCRLYARCSGLSSTVQMAAVIVTYIHPELTLVTLNLPERVYDSRVGNPPLGVTKGKLTNGATRVVDCTEGGAVPGANVKAVLVNLTVTGTNAAGFLALFRTGIAWPGNSSINWDHVNQTSGNMALVATDTLSRITAYCALGASTDFIVDVLGYYV